MERITIYCPECGRRVAEWDGRSTTNVIVNCRKCRKRVVFDVNTMRTTIKEQVSRASASGIRF